MVHHPEAPAAALAHGVAKSSDIMRVRAELGAAELRAASELQTAATRLRRHAALLLAGTQGYAGVDD